MKKINVILIIICSISILSSCNKLIYTIDDSVYNEKEINNYIEYKSYRSQYIIELIDSEIADDSIIINEEEFDAYCISKNCEIFIVEFSRLYNKMTHDEKVIDFFVGVVQVMELKNKMQEITYTERIDYLLAKVKEGNMKIYISNDIYIDELEIAKNFSKLNNIKLDLCLQSYVYNYYYYSYDLSIIIDDYKNSKDYKPFDMILPQQMILEQGLETDQAYEYADEYYLELQKAINKYYSYLNNYVENNLNTNVN